MNGENVAQHDHELPNEIAPGMVWIHYNPDTYTNKIQLPFCRAEQFEVLSLS